MNYDNMVLDSTPLLIINLWLSMM